jgi:hypothetical protein
VQQKCQRIHARWSRGCNLHLLSRRDLYLSFRYAFHSPYRRSPVEGEPFLRRAVCTLESIPKRLGNSSWGCSRYDCSYSSSPNRRRVFLLPRNLARRLSSRVRPPIRTKDRIPLPEAKILSFYRCSRLYWMFYLLQKKWNIFISTNAANYCKRIYPRNVRIVYVPFLMRMLLLLVAGDSRWHRRRSHATPVKKVDLYSNMFCIFFFKLLSSHSKLTNRQINIRVLRIGLLRPSDSIIAIVFLELRANLILCNCGRAMNPAATR